MRTAGYRSSARRHRVIIMEQCPYMWTEYLYEPVGKGDYLDLVLRHPVAVVTLHTYHKEAHVAHAFQDDS